MRKARPGRRTCLGHPLFPDQVEALAAQVEALRARFFRQYRLFFRYHRASRIIVYAWVNDELTKRACERSDDAYRVFQKMLERGHPPDDWENLLLQAQREAARLRAIAGRARRG